MLKMLLQTFAVSLGLVAVVLGIMVLIGKTEFLPYFIGAAVLSIGDFATVYFLGKNGAFDAKK